MAASCEIGGRTLAYERTGSGPPLLLINGFAATKDDWDPSFLDSLAREHELIRFDNRGIGASSDDGRPFTIAELAEDAAALITALDLERPAILGWSLGGFVALALAVARPELVGRLVLLSTTGGGSTTTLASDEVRAQLHDLTGTPREQARRLISLLFLPERAREIDAEFGEIVAAAREALRADLVGRQWEAMQAWERRDDADDLARIPCPALVATGTGDAVIPPANAYALAAALDAAWLAPFPRCGHAFMADHPAALSRLIAAFLSVG